MSEQPIIYRIADKQPEFPCWLWSKTEGWATAIGPQNVCSWDTHWCHSDTRPTVTPEAEQRLREFSGVAEQLESDSFTEVDAAAPSPQLPAEVREAIENVLPQLDGGYHHRVSQICAAIAPFFAASQPSADVEKVAEEISLEVFGETEQIRHKEVATHLHRLVAAKEAEIASALRREDAATNGLSVAIARAERAEAELAELRSKWTEATRADAVVQMSIERDALKSEVERLRQDNHNIQDNYGVCQRAHEKAVSERDALKSEVERLKADNEIIGGRHLCEKGHGWVVNGQPCYLCQQARIEAHIADRDKFAAQVSELRTQLASTEQQLKAAREDSERLDWLEDDGHVLHVSCWHYTTAKENAWTIHREYGNLIGADKMLRAAIDVARKAP